MLFMRWQQLKKKQFLKGGVALCKEDKGFSWMPETSEGADLCITDTKYYQGNLGLALPFYWCLHLQLSLCAQSQTGFLAWAEIFNAVLTGSSVFAYFLFPKPKCCQTRIHLTLNEIWYSYTALLLLLHFFKPAVSMLQVSIGPKRLQESIDDLKLALWYPESEWTCPISLCFCWAVKAASGFQRIIQ